MISFLYRIYDNDTDKLFYSQDCLVKSIGNSTQIILEESVLEEKYKLSTNKLETSRWDRVVMFGWSKTLVSFYHVSLGSEIMDLNEQRIFHFDVIVCRATKKHFLCCYNGKEFLFYHNDHFYRSFELPLLYDIVGNIYQNKALLDECKITRKQAALYGLYNG